MTGKTMKFNGSKWATRLLVASLALAAAGCFDEGLKAGLIDAAGPGANPPPPSATPMNRAPTISGVPATTAKISIAYSFQPTARDPDGDRLTFEILSKPDWATFNSATGRLEGTPPAGSSGTFTGIQITVSDGKTTSALPAFNIDVLEPVTGSAELAWEPPTTYEDGTPLSDLAGYVIRYGKSAGALDQSIRVQGPGTTMYVVENLNEGTWYFSLASVNGSGVESRPTAYVSKTIS